MTQSTEIKSIEKLKEEYDRLHKQQIRAQANLENANEELGRLEAAALQQFGTSDVGKLKVKLEQMETENEKRRRDYQTLLDAIAADLVKIESGDVAEDLDGLEMLSDD